MKESMTEARKIICSKHYNDRLETFYEQKKTLLPQKTKKTEKTLENLCLYTDATLSWRWSGSKCNVTYRYMGEWSE